MSTERILVVDDQVEVLEYLTELLCQSGYKVRACGNSSSALAAIEEEGSQIELAILDLDLGRGSDDGMSLLRDIKARQPDLPVIILTGKGGTRAAVQAIKLGAVDFLEKGAYLTTNLAASVQKADQFLKIVRENRRLKEETQALRQETEYYRQQVGLKRRMVGSSTALKKCLAEARAVAAIPRPVLVRGQRGTGKELIAAAIHEQSPRSAGPFITVNCAALSGNLLESEMFGHEKGAFTGSQGRKLGRFELADGGTLFLDEIGNMSADFQEMILRVVEYQRFERVQGTKTVEVDVRVIAATNADIETMMETGAFRSDLYDRLAFKEIFVPPLVERPEDIPELVSYFLEELAHEVPSLSPRKFTPAALAGVQEMPWPGNVRQLKNFVECLALEANGPLVDVAALESAVHHSVVAGQTFGEKVENFQKGLLKQALSAANGNQRAASKALNLTYDQFRHYYRKFDLGGQD